MNERKNIVFLMTDQHRLDHWSALAGSKLETPNLARLAESVAFTKCVTVNPICTPARTALLTGKYPRQIGTLNMSGDLSLEHPTYMRAMRQAGYWVAGIGKFHWLQTWPWQRGRGQGVDLVALKPRMQDFGLDYIWESSGKQLALKNYCDYCEHLQNKRLLEQYRDHVEARGNNSDDARKTVFTGEAWPLPEEDYVDIVTGDRIVEAIRERPKDKPMMLFGSFCGPHQPFDPPQSYLDRVPYEEVDDFVTDDEPMPEETKKRMWKLRRAYKAMLLVIDDQVGRIMDTLEAEGILDSTVVLFTTDHGEMLGDHLRMQKSTYYRDALTVPTGIRHPDYLGKRVIDTPVELTDLTATMLEIAGLDPREALGKPWPAFHNIVPCRSLMPIVRGETDRVRDYAFAECRNGWQAVVSDDWKYVRHLGYDNPDAPAENLFNTREDPHERVDRASDSECAETLSWHRRRRDCTIDHAPPAQLSWAPLIGGEEG